MSKLQALREELKKSNVNAFIIPSNDAFQSEFTPVHDRRLEWLTGFTGSFGAAVVTQNKAALFTDGRYTIQAKNEVPETFEQYNISDIKPVEWLKKTLQEKETIGLDPWLHTVSNVKQFGACSIKFVENLVDNIWHGKPDAASEKITQHPIKYAGQKSKDKRFQLSRYIQYNHSNAAIITNPDSICWLLNIRGNDVPCSPIALCYAILHEDQTVDLFIDTRKIDNALEQKLEGVSIYDANTISKKVKELKNSYVMLDPKSTPVALYNMLHEEKVILKDDPCQIPKACKNDIEVKGAINAHIRDGVAVTKFLYWLEQNNSDITELDIDKKILEFRKRQELFKFPSFETIAGFGANGAIVHYRVNEKTAKVIKPDGILLVDSGGQYLDGTTDITRTIAIGSPSDEQKHRFTLVLKGHIAIATAEFDEETTGSDLDPLARKFLQDEDLDYDHGTGHGVGSYLNVHEGPQRISKSPNQATLQAGMIVSNEPGYYKENEYGIRIENLVVIVNKRTGVLGFETLTLVPLDTRLIDWKILTNEEKTWVKNYHKNVVEKITPHLEEEERKWLENYISTN